MSLPAASSVGSIAGESPEKKLPDPASLSSPSLLLLPDEILLNCFARVPRCYYPAISLVSRTLRRLIASPEIYVERSVLCRTEHVLYVLIISHPLETPHWFTLNLKPSGNAFGTTENNHRLVPIPSFPSIPDFGASIITAGSEIYVLGGIINGESVSTVFVIDCPSHSRRFLPSMREPRKGAAGGIIDGKLYVVGGCNPQSLNWVESFDIKTQTWESVSGLNNVDLPERSISSFVMNDKIYFMDRKSGFVYDPKEGKLKRDLMMKSFWKEGSCVIDNMLYSFHFKYRIVVYNPIRRDWRLIPGLKDLPEARKGSIMVNHGGRLAILFTRKECPTEIWCTEVALERQGGIIRGRVLWSNHVLTLKEFSFIERSLAVTV